MRGLDDSGGESAGESRTSRAEQRKKRVWRSAREEDRWIAMDGDQGLARHSHAAP